jgi:hypothetical protein
MVKKRSVSPKGTSATKSRQMEDFMKRSLISPAFQFGEDNYPISHQSHTPHTPHTPHASHMFQGIGDKLTTMSRGDGESYASSSSDDSYTGDESDEIDSVDDSYANATMKKDVRIYRMKDILSKKRKQMFDKEVEIKDIGKQNSFLKTVLDDYENYNNIILEEKVKQKKALKILSDHIREISRNIKNDDFKLNRVKTDQTLLLEEIQNIRDEIEYVLRARGDENKYISSDDEYYFSE